MFKIISLFLLTSLFAQASPVPSNTLKFGDGTASTKSLIFNTGSGSNNPEVIWNNSAGVFQQVISGTPYTLYPLPSPSPSGQFLSTTGTGYALQNVFPLPSPTPSGAILQASGVAWLSGGTSITTYGTHPSRHEWIVFGGGGFTNCGTSSTCTIVNQSGAFSSVTSSSVAGVYTITINNGVCSVAPSVLCNGWDVTNSQAVSCGGPNNNSGSSTTTWEGECRQSGAHYSGYISCNLDCY